MLNNEHEYTESHESQGQLFGSFGQLPPFGQWVFDKSRVRFCGGEKTRMLRKNANFVVVFIHIVGFLTIFVA